MNVEFTEQEKKEVLDATKLIREKADEFGKNSTEFKSAIAKTEKVFNDFEDKNSKQLADFQTKQKEAEDRVKTLEGIIANFNHIPQDQKKIYHDIVNILCKQNFNEANAQIVDNYFRNLPAKLSLLSGAEKFDNLVLQTKANANIWRTEIGQLGGFRVPIEWSNELARLITEKTPVRAFCSIKQIGSKTFKQPVKGVIPKAVCGDENETSTDNTQSKTSEIELTVKKRQYTVKITRDDLIYDLYNVSQEILNEASEAFANLEGYIFIKGSGAGDEGMGIKTLAVAGGFPQIHETATATLDFTDLIQAAGKLKTGYNPIYLMNRLTVAYLRTIVDDVGRYIWVPFGEGASGPGATINGYRYSGEAIDCDNYDVSSGYPVFFGDLTKAIELLMVLVLWF